MGDAIKVLMLNGSPRANGNIALAFHEMIRRVGNELRKSIGCKCHGLVKLKFKAVIKF